MYEEKRTMMVNITDERAPTTTVCCGFRLIFLMHAQKAYLDSWQCQLLWCAQGDIDSGIPDKQRNAWKQTNLSSASSTLHAHTIAACHNKNYHTSSNKALRTVIEPLQRQGRMRRPNVASGPSRQMRHCFSSTGGAASGLSDMS